MRDQSVVDRPARPSVDERTARGREARRQVPRSAHRDWVPNSARPDPVSILEAQNARRIPWLVPIRHARMAASPFSFFRGAAAIMAADLAPTPVADLHVQLSGDAHLANFGAYASPARELVFDQNDFDETLPGPFEWDVKRLAASFWVAGAHLGFEPAAVRTVVAASIESYRTAMIRFGRSPVLDLWYDHTTTADIGALGAWDAAELAKRLDRFQRRAQSRTSLQALQKLAEDVDGEHRIRSQPPVLVPLRDLPPEYDPDTVERFAEDGLARYKESLPDDRRVLVDRYHPVDFAVKVVGVGSVGTYCLVALLEGRDREDPLFLRVKEADRSVLEDHAPPSRYANHGQRVVEGQRLIQAESDIFLGWTAGGAEHRHFYVRQLRDWKGSVEIEGATPEQLAFYARLCGMVLARGHARSGDPVAIAAYLGKSDRFDAGIVDFAERYAAQNQADYERFIAAIDSGRLEAAATTA